MKICDKCRIENPYNANFCRNCRNVFTKDKFVDAIEEIHKEIDIKTTVIQSLENKISTLKEEISLIKEKSTQQVDVLRVENKRLSYQHIDEIRTVNQRLSDTQIKLKAESVLNKNKVTAIFILVIFNVVMAVILFNFYSEKERLSTSNSEIKYTLDEQVLVKQREDSNRITELTGKLQSITTYSNAPVIIKSLKEGNKDDLGNVISDFGEKISNENAMYLTPRIDVIVLKKGSFTFQIKLFENNELQTNSESLSGYSYSDVVVVDTDVDYELSGWGSKTRGYWPSGNYRTEIWYDGYCLKSLDFLIE